LNLRDIVVYIESLEARISAKVLLRVQLLSPFILRTAVPPISAAEGKKVLGLRRLGKRIVFELESGLFLVIHLMIAGRLRWTEGKAKPKLPGRIALALFGFDSGTLVLTEAGTKRMASLHLVKGEAALNALHVAGMEVLDADITSFSRQLKAHNHTLKRALTNPHIFSGIGNAYSDEILHRAKLSPIAMTQKLDNDEIARLYGAIRSTLDEWTARLREQADGKFPARRWRCMAATASRAPFAVRRCSALFTAQMKPTIAPAARRAGRSSPTARCRACSRKAGRVLSTNSNDAIGTFRRSRPNGRLP